MELRQLRYLEGVARHGSFSRAAAVLHVAQSALSEQVARLERELGARLLVRDRRGVRPTPLGEAVLARVARVLGEVDGLVGDVQQARGRLSGAVGIGTLPPIGSLDVAGLLAEFHAVHPEVDLRLWEGTVEQAVALVRGDALDAAFVACSPADLPAPLTGITVGHEEIVVACAAGHGLTRHTAVPLEALAGEPLATLSPETGLRRTVDQALAEAGVTPRIAFESNHGSMVRALAARGLGVALLPRGVVASPGPAVEARPLAPEPLRFPLTLGWRAARHHGPAAEAFLALARSRLDAGD